MPKMVPAWSDLGRGYGQRLVAARKAIGLSAADLCRLLNVSKARLSHWETERHPPDVTAMLALKHWHGVSLDWVFAGDPSGLPARILQPMVTAGAAMDAPPELRKLRAMFTTPPPRAGLHEAPPPDPV